MAFTHTYRIGVTGAGNASQSFSVPITADAEDNREIDLPAGQANQLVDFDLDVSQLKALFVTVRATTGELASGSTVTIKTNSSGSPSDTLTCTAPGGIAYVSSFFGANPFTSATDVTQVYMTNGSATQAVRVILWALVDATL